MASTTKGKALRVWVQDDVSEALRKLSDLTDIPESGLSARLIRAALEALSREGGRITFPLKFEVSQNRGKDEIEPESRLR